MLGIHDFFIFLAAGIILNLTPGQDTFYILGRSISQGRNAGIASAIGISAAAWSILWPRRSASALLAASASAFLAVKLAGAAYLIYLGLRMLLSRPSTASLPGEFSSSGFFPVFQQGMLTNVLNPKVALFFLAFMPQFIAADSPNKFLAFITLGLCFVTTGAIWCFCLVWFASQLGDRLRENMTFREILNRAAGALFVLLGIRLAVSR